MSFSTDLEEKIAPETQTDPRSHDTTGAGDLLACDFCAHRCFIPPGRTGRCGVRHHLPASGGETGTIVTTVYGQIQAAATDPIEKKPLYHFLPGSSAFSVALGGCNFRCRFCQNDQIAFADRLGPPLVYWEPRELVAAWRRSGSPTIAFTYTEPGVWQDYLVDCAQIARREGARIVMVSNGFLTPEAVERLLPVVDGFNIDLKGNDSFYRTLCRAREMPVLETIRSIAPRRHLEVTTMLLERYHDSTILHDLEQILSRAGVQVWHLSRFHPAGRMKDEPATTEAFLREALESLRGGIPYLYAGNSRISEYHRTLCPECGTLCIARGAGVIDQTEYGACPECGHRIYGLFQ